MGANELNIVKLERVIVTGLHIVMGVCSRPARHLVDVRFIRFGGAGKRWLLQERFYVSCCP